MPRLGLATEQDWANLNTSDDSAFCALGDRVLFDVVVPRIPSRPITSGGPRRELRPLRRPLRRPLASQVVARIPPGARHAVAAHASCRRGRAYHHSTSDGGRACTAGHLWAGRATSPPRERRPARARVEIRPPAPVPRQRGSARRARRVVRVARQAIHVATYCDLPPGSLRTAGAAPPRRCPLQCLG